MFQNRKEAGKLLSQKLKFCKNSKNAVILAIPRGGVVVGRQIADRLHIPLLVLVVKKLGAPHNPELAIGALAPSGVKYIDWDLVLRSGIEQEYLDREIKEKREEVEERIKKLKISRLSGIHDAVIIHSSQTASGQNTKIQIGNYKTLILVDDGIATGATTLAAIKYLKKQKTNNLPAQADKEQKIILAVPVIAKDTYNKLKSEVDKIAALEIPESFQAVGQFYQDFPQVSDEEVVKYLK